LEFSIGHGDEVVFPTALAVGEETDGERIEEFVGEVDSGEIRKSGG
jgi:hypothetical protein